jgi:hypothetical protein
MRGTGTILATTAALKPLRWAFFGVYFAVALGLAAAAAALWSSELRGAPIDALVAALCAAAALAAALRHALACDEVRFEDGQIAVRHGTRFAPREAHIPASAFQSVTVQELRKSAAGPVAYSVHLLGAGRPVLPLAAHLAAEDRARALAMHAARVTGLPFASGTVVARKGRGPEPA